MNFKRILLAIITLFCTSLFISHNVKAQDEGSMEEEQPATKCIDFQIKIKGDDKNPMIYDYCYFLQLNTMVLFNRLVLPNNLPQGSEQIGKERESRELVCLDDFNIEKKIGEYGTHCGPKPEDTKKIVCGPNTDLKDCIGSRLPGKSGKVGSVITKPVDLISAIAKIINSLLSLVGLLFTTYLIYAGIQWIHYGGNPEGIARASKRIKNAIIGLAITLSAYSLSYYILNSLAN